MGRNLEAFHIQQESEQLWDDLAESSFQGGEFLTSKTLRKLADNELPPAKVLRIGVAKPGESDLLAGWALLLRKRYGIRYNYQFSTILLRTALA